MFNPDLFWNLAESLLQSQNADECKCRTAANRAYYAFLLTLRLSLETKHKISFRHDANDHSEIVRILQSRNRDALAEALRSLLRLRETADYEL